jgi:hypothetical protein
MRKKCYLIFILFFITHKIYCQKPIEVLNFWSDQFPIEKVYLQFDRDTYATGETAWFKAYMYSEFMPDTISTSLFVELLDDSSHIVSREVFPILFSTAYGQINIPDSIKEGVYFIRAYSPTMLNNNPDFIYTHTLYIFSRNNSDITRRHQKESFVHLQFFPESGNFISGENNVIAFKASSQYGLPVKVSGIVKNAKGQTILAFNSIHDGMGKFEIVPADNEKYYAILDNDSSKKKYDLPESSGKSIGFHITEHSIGKVVYLLRQNQDPNFHAAYIIGQSQNKIVFKQQLPYTDTLIKGQIKTGNLNSGILQITVFNKDDMPLAERLVFINNKEYIQDAALSFDTINLSNRGKNQFDLFLKDTVNGAFSISVTDPDYDLYPKRQENIFSNLLLTSDLPGYINDPAYYFSNDNDSISEDLDLLMMTNGWRRFKWTELMSGKMPSVKYIDPGFISLKGNAKISGSKKYFTNNDMSVFISSFDSTSIIMSTQADEKGNFNIDSVLLIGDFHMLFFDSRKGLKRRNIDIHINSDSLRKNYPLPPLNSSQFTSLNKYNLTRVSAGENFSDDYYDMLNYNAKLLPNITLKLKTKTALQLLESRYESGLFSSPFARTLDLTKEHAAGLNVFEYLTDLIPGIVVVQNKGDYQVYDRDYGRNVQNVQSGGTGAPTPMTIYLDEMEVDPIWVSSIPLSDIALVKVFNRFIGGTGNSPGGALAIYTKKGEDLYKNNNFNGGNRVAYHGYSIIKQFYSPDYTVDTSTKKNLDQRITLRWIPNLLIKGVNPKIPIVFFNNDRTRRFRIVVEGITTTGKLESLEKIVDAKNY